MNENDLLPGRCTETTKINQQPTFSFTPVEKSEWKCYLFGSMDGSGLAFQPRKGAEPNWFWRKMQFLILGNTWVKNER